MTISALAVELPVPVNGLTIPGISLSIPDFPLTIPGGGGYFTCIWAAPLSASAPELAPSCQRVPYTSGQGAPPGRTMALP